MQFILRLALTTVISMLAYFGLNTTHHEDQGVIVTSVVLIWLTVYNMLNPQAIVQPVQRFRWTRREKIVKTFIDQNGDHVKKLIDEHDTTTKGDGPPPTQ